ncbi:MAG: hypothetical protein N4A59_16355 [Marinifilum sp.]|jgi:hypothetical protein|nr:hypothetical protein [Marinifilum sp.]
MRENETSVTFHIDKKLMKDFDEASKMKSEQLGIPLNRKQSLHLAIKEAIDNWQKETPTD